MMRGISLGARRGQSKMVADEKEMWGKIRHKRYEYGGVADKNLRGEVMSVSVDLPGVSGDMRPVYAEKKRCTTRADRLRVKRKNELTPVRSVDWLGMRASTALMSLACLALVLAFLYCADYAKVSEAKKTVDSLQRQLIRSSQIQEDLRVRYESASADVNVAYAAKQHGLVSAKSVPAIMLYAPQNAQIRPADASATLPGETLATILGD